MRSMTTFCGALLLAVPSLAAPASSRTAQSLLVKFDRYSNTVSVEATRASIVDVVQQLFSQAGAPRTDIDRDVRGRVTLNLRGVTRDSALGTALAQVDAGYRVSNGVYMIRSNRPSGRDDRRERDDRDGRGGRGEDDSDRNIRIEDAPAAFLKKVDMAATDRPLGETVRTLARMAGVNIAIDRSVPGDLTLDVMAKNEVLWFVLQRMANAAHLKLEVTSPQHVIFRPLPSFAAYYRGRRIGGSTGELFSCRNCRFNELKRGWRYCPMCGERVDR